MRTAFIAAACTLLIFALSGPAAAQVLAVGPQYDTSHVYVASEDFEHFVRSFMKTFGGTAEPEVVANVTPTPSTTKSQILRTPVGVVSVFGYVTPVPAPFGTERNGFLVRDFDAAVNAARADGAGVIVAPYEDAVGRDAIIQWPGGVNMQLYSHNQPPHAPALETIPENRVYIAPEKANEFVHDYLAFTGGKIVEDDRKAPGAEIGEPYKTFRRIAIESLFGKTLVLATDGHLPYPWGRETTGYEVSNLDKTILRAEAAGAFVIVEPYVAAHRRAAILQFPGGYIAEVHTPLRH